MHANICTHTQTHTHTYMHTLAHMHACTRTHTHRIYACLHANLHTHFTHIHAMDWCIMLWMSASRNSFCNVTWKHRKALFSTSLQCSHLRSMSKACAQQTTECWQWTTFSSLTATIQPTAAVIAPRGSLSVPVQPVFPWHLFVTTRMTAEMAAMKLIAVSSDDGFAHRQQHEGSTCTWQHFTSAL